MPNAMPNLSSPQQPDHSQYDQLIAQHQSAPFETPPGGYPSANPDNIELAPTPRANAMLDRDAAREAGAYGDASYTESCLQKGKPHSDSDAFNSLI